ncbi:MAG: AAA family ATPase [Candidatus Diapherotrites archaeon]|jgi:KaiC/GvpD/RAD55 family RecA-like ATPase|uniref:AAA family ATPase n=1 Tax=Candidatus Iainarchaeum sp. TaxID=3101447 RepID=A0A8T5GFY6_9ARCH|nr:AAA family ATPase [Candidatus Diapherotrites archaeon]
MNRITTGITGFDDLIEGGFPEGRSFLVSGGTGTGKTIFAVQFLMEGAAQGEPGVYLTLDERPDLIREDMLRFGWNMRQLEDSEQLKIIDGTIAKIGIPSDEEFSLPATGFDLDKLLLELMRTIKKIKARRVVIDSIPALGMNFENEHDVRKAILKIIYLLSRAGVTTLLTTEVNEGSKQFGKYGVEEFVSDGVIVLHYMGIGTQSNRTLHIRKMRATKHSEDLHPLEITESGLKIHKVEEDYDI